MYAFCTRVRCAEGKPVRLPRRRDSVRLGRLRPRSHCAGPQSAERLAQDLTTCFAWSPKRSARLDTPLRFWLSCLLALPTVLARPRGETWQFRLADRTRKRHTEDV